MQTSPLDMGKPTRNDTVMGLIPLSPVPEPRMVALAISQLSANFTSTPQAAATEPTTNSQASGALYYICVTYND